MGRFVLGCGPRPLASKCAPGVRLRHARCGLAPAPKAASPARAPSRRALAHFPAQRPHSTNLASRRLTASYPACRALTSSPRPAALCPALPIALPGPVLAAILSLPLGALCNERRGVQKSILERAAPPTFDVAVEMVSREQWRVHLDVGLAVDMLLAGQEPSECSALGGGHGGAQQMVIGVFREEQELGRHERRGSGPQHVGGGTGGCCRCSE